jgi:hypothetical protein
VFMVPDVPVSSNRSYIVCKKSGYFNSSQNLKTAGTAVAVTDQNGKFSINAPRNKQVALNAYGFDGIKSQEQIINTPDGAGFNNQTITINDGGSSFVPEAVYFNGENKTGYRSPDEL